MLRKPLVLPETCLDGNPSGQERANSLADLVAGPDPELAKIISDKPSAFLAFLFQTPNDGPGDLVNPPSKLAVRLFKGQAALAGRVGLAGLGLDQRHGLSDPFPDRFYALTGDPVGACTGLDYTRVGCTVRNASEAPRRHGPHGHPGILKMAIIDRAYCLEVRSDAGSGYVTALFYGPLDALLVRLDYRSKLPWADLHPCRRHGLVAFVDGYAPETDAPANVFLSVRNRGAGYHIVSGLHSLAVGVGDPVVKLLVDRDRLAGKLPLGIL